VSRGDDPLDCCQKAGATTWPSSTSPAPPARGMPAGSAPPATAAANDDSKSAPLSLAPLLPALLRVPCGLTEPVCGSSCRLLGLSTDAVSPHLTLPRGVCIGVLRASDELDPAADTRRSNVSASILPSPCAVSPTWARTDANSPINSWAAASAAACPARASVIARHAPFQSRPFSVYLISLTSSQVRPGLDASG
jgi:hypothetical protein